MNLYQIKLACAFPGLTESEALKRFQDELEISCVQEDDFSIIIPKDDYAKIFKLARTLYNIADECDINVSETVSIYVKKLGYELSDDDLYDGVLKWVERFCDFDEDEIDDWLK